MDQDAMMDSRRPSARLGWVTRRLNEISQLCKGNENVGKVRELVQQLDAVIEDFETACKVQRSQLQDDAEKKASEEWYERNQAA